MYRGAFAAGGAGKGGGDTQITGALREITRVEAAQKLQ